MHDAMDSATQSSSLGVQIRQVLRETGEPLTFADLRREIGKLYPKGAKGAPKPPKAEAIQQELDAALTAAVAFEHPPLRGKAKRYSINPPPPPPDPIDEVRIFVMATLEGEGLFKESQLAKKPKGMGQTEFKRTLDGVIQELVREKRLYEHPSTGRTKLYARHPPPPQEWHEEPRYARAFNLVEKAARNFLAKEDVNIDRLLAKCKHLEVSHNRRKIE